LNNPPVKQGWVRWTYRYLSGRPLDGYRRTDCGYLRRGTTALTVTGRASRWAHLPGWRRQLWRLGIPAGTAALLTAYAYAPVPTLLAAVAGAVFVGYRSGYAVYRTLRAWRYNRGVVQPLAAALAPFAEMGPEEVRTGLVLPAPGAEQIRIPLAPHHGGQKAKVADMERIVAQRLGGEWDTSLQLRQSPFYLHFTPRPAPPAKVPFAMVREAVLATTQDRPVLGLGTRAEPLHLDFTGEIAHLAASIGTGGGKSAFLRFLVAQFAHHGVRDFLVADVKWVSLQGMEDVPGLQVYRDVEEIWDALALARAEMDRRYRVLLADRAAVFPRKVILMEEQNAFALETAIRWKEVRPRGEKANMAPVWNDIALLLLKARQVNMNLIGVYQRMSAEAAGGGDLPRPVRPQGAVPLFPAGLGNTLVGSPPPGTSSAIPGRAIAILGGLAAAGATALDHHRTRPWTWPPPVPLSQSRPPLTSRPRPLSQRDVTPRYTLAEAARQEWCTLSYDALRQAAHRARKTGRVATPVDGQWTQEDLAAVLTGRTSR
jgi:hypothetical protein